MVSLPYATFINIWKNPRKKKKASLCMKTFWRDLRDNFLMCMWHC